MKTRHLFFNIQQFITALFHQPLWRGCGSTDTYGFYIIQPIWLNLSRTLYEVGIGVHSQALVIEHLSITALASTDKENQVVTGGKLRDIGHAIGHRATDGIKAPERRF
jgi:hypothetical protein